MYKLKTFYINPAEQEAFEQGILARVNWNDENPYNYIAHPKLHSAWNAGFGAVMTEVGECYDISKDDASAIIQNSKFKKFPFKDEHLKEGSYIMEMFHEGKWKQVARTDMCDDVRIMMIYKPGEEFSLDELIRKCVYGARITDDTFYAITHISDH